MTQVNCTNGVVLHYDETIKVGDIISAYQKGFHRVTEIRDRGANATPLIGYETVARENGTLAKTSSVKHCDASYCRHAAGVIKEEVEKHMQAVGKLQFLLASFGL